jgi:hypothetical protein
VSGGSHTITKGATGIWHLAIPGHSQNSGTLIVSAEVDSASATGTAVSEAIWSQPTSRGRKFEQAGTDTGDVALCVNGAYPVFSNSLAPPT